MVRAELRESSDREAVEDEMHWHDLPMALRELGRALTPKERVTWEARLQALAGERIAEVRYLEIDYRDPDQDEAQADANDEPAWVGPGFHALDYGLEIDFASGLQWWFSWQLPGSDGESLLMGHGRALTHEVEGGRLWNVSDTLPWSQLAGVPIVDTQIQWDHWPAGSVGASPEFWCQNAYLLAFRDGAEVVIALGDRDVDSGEFQPAADTIAVFSSRDDAARHGFSFPG